MMYPFNLNLNGFCRVLSRGWVFMKERVEPCTWCVTVKKQEAKRGYEGPYTAFVMRPSARSAHRLCYTQNT